jgi:hypothetical protein
VSAWKLLFQSIQGTGHRRNGQPCQDRCRVRLEPTGGETVLVLACADGAGSATHAETGAHLACDGITRLVRADLREGLPVAHLDRDTACSWYLRLRQQLGDEADRLGIALRQLACTLLLAVVGETAAAFSQTGDGVLVVAQEDGYEPVFWPQSGEYANTTNFVTDPEWADHLAFAHRPARVDELALLTDGLQTLALNFAPRTVHAPFFRPMFERLRAAVPGAGLPRALRQFLDSEPVNARTDDDKTLILATRVPPRAPTTQPS